MIIDNDRKNIFLSLEFLFKSIYNSFIIVVLLKFAKLFISLSLLKKNKRNLIVRQKKSRLRLKNESFFLNELKMNFFCLIRNELKNLNLLILTFNKILFLFEILFIFLEIKFIKLIDLTLLNFK